ncbi:MAG: tetratricopeptide repeat protein [Pyrinomonadaceae bacterium]
MIMTVGKSLSLLLLLHAFWLLLPALATQTKRTGAAVSQPAKQPQTQAKEDELARHLSAAETYQLSGDLARAAVENRMVVAIALRRLGSIAVREGQFQRAVQLLGGSLALRDDATARTDLSIAHMRLMEVDGALAEARAALNLDPKNARARHILGKLFYMKGDYASARPELERAVVLEPDLDAAYTLGMTYLRLKDTGRAKLLFEEMQAALDNSAAAHNLFGRAYYETGFPAEAEREFKQALAIDPNTTRAHFYLGYVILQHGGSERLPQAAAAFERELQLHPRDFYSNFFLGVLASGESDHPKAVRRLLEATRLKPGSGEAHLFLGQSQAELNDPAAEQSLRRAIELTADATANSYQIKRAHFLLGRLLIKLGRRAEGEKELAVARELQSRSLESTRQEVSEILNQVAATTSDSVAPSRAAAPRPEDEKKSDESGGESVLLIEESALDAQAAAKVRKFKHELSVVLAQAYHNLGVIAAQQGQLAASLEQFAAAALWEPGLAGLDRNWGIVSFRAAQYDKAIPLLARQVQAQPDDTLARRMLGVSYYLTRDFWRAAQTLRPIEMALVGDPELAYTYGVSLVQLAEHKAAAGVFARLAEQQPKNAPARFYAAQGFVMIEDYERALKEFQAVAALDPNLPQVHYGAGQSLIRLNRLEEAEQEFRQELKLNPADETAKYHLAYVLLERKQQIAEALALLREAVAARPDYADARYQLGKALIEQGDVNAAVEQLETAARIAPATDYIRYQLSIAYRRTSRPADAERELQLYRELKASSRSRELPGVMGGKPNVP